MFSVAGKMSLYGLGRGSPSPPPPCGYAHAHVKILKENFISAILQPGSVNCSLNSLLLGPCPHSILVSVTINSTNMAATSHAKLGKSKYLLNLDIVMKKR